MDTCSVSLTKCIHKNAYALSRLSRVRLDIASQCGLVNLVKESIVRSEIRDE